MYEEVLALIVTYNVIIILIYGILLKSTVIYLHHIYTVSPGVVVMPLKG